MLTKVDFVVGYHVTQTRKVRKILRQGLIPMRGPRSRQLGEPHDAVYLFKHREDVDDALMGWLGEAMPDDSPLTLLQVLVQAGARLLKTTADYEFVVAERVPPANVKVLIAQL